MARGKTEKRGARRSAAEDRAQDRVAQNGERADYLKIRPGNANFNEPVASDIARLQGRSRAGTTPDDRRGSASPLGHGEVAEREEARKRRR
jgi:hypothetical protein